MGGRRLIIVTALAAGGLITWSALRQGRAPYPSQFVGVGAVYTVAILLGEASPVLGAILAVGATIGLGYTAVAAQQQAPSGPAAVPAGGGAMTPVQGGGGSGRGKKA